MRLHRVPPLDRAFLACYSIYKRYFEAGPIDGLKQFAPHGALVIDVGANVGFFAVRFAKWVDGGRVIAIEPEEANYNHLLSTLRRAGLLDRVQVIRAVAAAALHGSAADRHQAAAELATAAGAARQTTVDAATAPKGRRVVA